MRPRLLQPLLPLLFVVLWSTGFLGAKYGLPYAEPLTFLSLRYALVIVLMIMLILIMRAPWPRDPRQIVHIAITGLLVQATYLGGVFVSIHLGLAAGVAALIVGLQPLLTAAGAGLWLGERVSRRQWTGLVLGFFGVVLVIIGKSVQDGAAALTIGTMLLPAFIALFGITLGTLYQRRYCPSFDLRTGSVIQFLPSLVVTVAIASQTESMQVVWSGQFIFAWFWLAVVLSLGAISVLNLLIRSGSAVNVASLFYLTPPTTALLAWLLFGEALTGLALLGMGVVVLGVWLARK
jgi:drug/metabolite transporter (DMT)-like permease